jgi:hypothetical protein
MLLIILVALVSLIFFARGLSDFVRSVSKRQSRPYISGRPAEIYYPTQHKKKETVPPQASRVEIEQETISPTANMEEIVEDSSPMRADIIERPSGLPRLLCVNEFRRPRRAVSIKDITNSKFNYKPERKQVERTLISAYDEEVYREAEKSRIRRENRLAEERNQRYLAQKQLENYRNR